MYPTLFELMAQIGLSAGVAAAATWGLLVWFGQKSIEARIARGLVTFKAERDVEQQAQKHRFDLMIETLKSDIARLHDRASKLHQREYEVLPEAWGLLNKAFGLANDASKSQAIYLGRANDPEAVAALIEGSDLADWQKAKLKGSPSWYEDFTQMGQDHKIIEARVAISDFSNYIILHGVFVEEPLLALMHQASGAIAKANEARWAIVEEINTPKDPELMDHHLSEAARLIGEIKLATRNRLFETRLSSSPADP